MIGVTYVVDAYAWIEYFAGTKAGERVKAIVDARETLLTLESSLAEVKSWAIREEQDFEEAYRVIRHNSRITPITLDIWLRGVEIRARERASQPDFGMLDALMGAAAEIVGAQIVSGDPHFREWPDVVHIG